MDVLCVCESVSEKSDKWLRLWVVIAGDLGIAQFILPFFYYRRSNSMQLHLRGKYKQTRFEVYKTVHKLLNSNSLHYNLL